MALTAKCLACKAKVTEAEYCAVHPDTAGCNDLIQPRLLQLEGKTCKIGAHVRCPGKDGPMCAGNQCCPRSKKSGGKTYPCPSAAPDWNATNKCESTKKVKNCVKQKECCFAATAECLACAADTSIAKYCAKHPDTAGCPKPCCKAATAKCLACAADMTEAEYCAERPDTVGCENNACCRAATAKCLACAAAMSEAEYCVHHPDTVGCPPPPGKCCLAGTAECMACSAGISVALFCSDHPTVPG